MTNDRGICTDMTSEIKHVEVKTLTIAHCEVKETQTLQISISRLLGAGLSRYLNTRAPTRFNRYIVAHRAHTQVLDDADLQSHDFLC